jgi:UDP:flavonoid glycosyltransferase YjiC (YdhE family)
VKVARVCWEAAERLRERYGIRDASPFSFVSTLSPFLNVYGEPPEFLKPEEREPFEPLAFFGSLARDEGAAPMPAVNGKLRVYVSFGTVIWRHYAGAALQALQAISQALSETEDVSVLVSLGKHDLPRDTAESLRRPNVRVETYVDQWEILRQTDVFVTHHGLNSTHEAILHRVPMISLPFFWDQPPLARRCREYGLAVPLIDALGEPVRPERVVESVLEVASRRDAMLASLDTAYGWERRVMAARPAVLERIKGLEAA